MKKIEPDSYGRIVISWMFCMFFYPLIFGQFLPEAELRPRAEYRYGYKQLALSDQDPIFIVSQRTRLGTRFKFNKIAAKIVVQDVRVWGDESQYSSSGVFGDNASIDLAEAWFSIRLNEHVDLMAGRQHWSFDDERLLAKRNWNQNGLYYDGLTVALQNRNWHVHVGLSYNNTGESNFEQPYKSEKMKSVGFLHVSRQVSEKFLCSVIFIGSAKTKNDSLLAMYVKSSSGANVQYTDQQLKLSGSFYYQFGKDVCQGLVNSANAYNLNLHGVYTAQYWSVNAGCSVLSGDHEGDATNQKTHLFDLLYGARHKYYGFLDYFSNLRKATNGGGLNDFFTGLGIPLCPTVGAWGACHVFYLNRLNGAVAKSMKVNHTYLGTEMDIWLDSTVNQMLNIQGGYSFILPGSTLKSIQNTNATIPFSSWAWVMVTVSLHNN